MILDTLAHADRYTAGNDTLKRAFDYLTATDLTSLPTGRIELGEQMYAVVMEEPGRDRAAAALEVHRRYIDIQLSLSGSEEMGWRPLETCQEPGPYDADTDLQFFAGAPDTWLTVGAGQFVIFFPEDAHAPMVSTGSIRKLVVKVPVG
jgi:biofilm protein TabA